MQYKAQFSERRFAIGEEWPAYALVSIQRIPLALGQPQSLQRGRCFVSSNEHDMDPLKSDRRKSGQRSVQLSDLNGSLPRSVSCWSITNDVGSCRLNCHGTSDT
jgi:hypothetical protein